MKILDFRSDTVTKPTPAMRQAMANAEVGDDVYREDPTVRALEEKAAHLTGKEAALFVPTGSMGNQVALHVWGRPGQSVLCDARAHIFHYEMGAPAALSGLLVRPLQGDADGALDPDEVERMTRPAPYYAVKPGVVSVEVTHNLCGGTLPSREKLKAAHVRCQERNIPVHMDGARIFNAAAAWNTDVASIAAHADSVMFCLSKGLGAPVGSVLCGPKAFIEEAVAARKRFGGGMRQAGILAAAGLHALEHHVARLADDHANARRLADGLRGVKGLSLDPARFPTNILFVETDPDAAPAWEKRLREQGILVNALSANSLRFITHLDVSASDVDEALQRMVALRRTMS